MALLVSDSIKLRLLAELEKSKELTISALAERIGNVNYYSAVRACEFLETIGLIAIEQKSTGERSMQWVRLTPAGTGAARHARGK